MYEKNTAGMYLMTSDLDEPFSIGYALLGPATNSYLIRRQEIAFVWDNSVLVRVSLLRQTNG